MHVITRKRLNDFAEEHPEVRSALQRWYQLARNHNFTSLEDLRATFSGVDRFGKLTIFDIGGNKVRLIAAIHYNRRRIYIRAVLTHEEYDRDAWKE